MSHPTRRTIAAGLAFAPVPALAARGPTIVMLGDSLTSGYGLPTSAALPVQLQAALKGLGQDAFIRNAGVSGDTTAGGLRRLDRSLPPGVQICIVALGANDLLLGADPAGVKANLDAILTRLKRRNILAVLVGVRAPPLGAYAGAFNAVYADLSRKHGAPLYPDILAGVMGVRALNQPDGLHPNAEGVRRIARGMAPTVAAAIRSLQES